MSNQLRWLFEEWMPSVTGRQLRSGEVTLSVFDLAGV